MTDLLRSLGAHERLAAIGVGIVAVSLLLPWYGVAFNDLVRTGVGSLSFLEVAIIITLGATAYLIVRSERGPVFPRPLHVGTLIALGGAWTIVLVIYRIVVRPDLGIFVALAGGVLVVVGGLRCRRDELSAERARSTAAPKTASPKTIGE